MLPTGAHGDFEMTFLGLPIITTEALPVLGNAGDVVLADMSHYINAIGFDVRVEASPHYAFNADLTTYRLTFLAEGKPQLTAPITLQDGVSTVSPFIQLDDKAS